MVTAFAHGVTAIKPVSTIERAQEIARQADDIVLAGERYGQRIDGFDLGNSPSEFIGLEGKRIVHTTTNGTVAVEACATAEQSIIGSLINLSAVSDYLTASQPDCLILVCAGTFSRVALEDVYAAGALLSYLGLIASEDDASLLARAIFQQWHNNHEAALRYSENGRKLIALNKEDDISAAADFGTCNLVPKLEPDGWLRC